ncbi:MAG: hypothetical protein HY934_04620 [Candidatus Firestonebacteria bacterium]|nr:hypothetical protein [Candidatus Firestonebacteria bacterium]
MPPGTTLGLSYHVTPKFLFGYDMHYYFPIAYDIDYFTQVAQKDAYVYVKESKRIRKNSVINYNLGGEYMISENIPLRFGFFSNKSLSPKVNINLQEKQSHLDNYGITLSSGLISENSTLMFNFKYGFGKGNMTTPNLDTGKMEIVDLKFASYALGFSGSYWF